LAQKIIFQQRWIFYFLDRLRPGDLPTGLWLKDLRLEEQASDRAGGINEGGL